MYDFFFFSRTVLGPFITQCVLLGRKDVPLLALGAKTFRGQGVGVDLFASMQVCSGLLKFSPINSAFLFISGLTLTAAFFPSAQNAPKFAFILSCLPGMTVRSLPDVRLKTAFIKPGLDTNRVSLHSFFLSETSVLLIFCIFRVLR